MRIRTETYTLPAHWASYLINGDGSGMEAAEVAEVDSWLAARPELGSCIGCGEQEFSWRNDADNLGGDVAEFTFYRLRKVDRAYTRPYVGMANGGWGREVFRSATTPTAEGFPRFAAVIGPFRTMAGARLCAANPMSPSLVTVADYERAAILAREVAP